MSLALLLSVALADDAPPPPPGTEVSPVATAMPPKTRQFLMEVNFRGRYLFLPDSVLDIWYFKHENGADGFPQRPSVRAYALGLEFVVKDDQANGIFYAEYISSLTPEGYWDDVDDADIEGNGEFTDGSYIVPEFLGLVAIGADYGYEVHANDWLSFLFGAGLGVGIKTGQLVEWDPGESEETGDGDNTEPDCGRTENAYQRKDHCADDGPVNVPAVIPILDANIGVRFNFSDRASLRIEGGLHNLIYGGAALGITF